MTTQHAIGSLNSKLSYNQNIDPIEVFSHANKKLGAPLIELASAKPIIARVLANVLTNQPELSPHFLGASLLLCISGVPENIIEDTVRMSYTDDQKINLTWSARRWKEEHELGGRRATAKALSNENIRYSKAMDNYLPRLNDSFPKDWVVSGSAMLGRHGLEMRHCVASYNDRIKSGSILILRAVIEESIYTVQLNSHLDDCVYIGQIKGAKNAGVPDSIRNQIAEMLGVNPTSPVRPLQSPRQYKIPSYLGDESFYAQFDELLRRNIGFNKSSLYRICLNFSGYGDSGSLDDVEFWTSCGSVIDLCHSHSGERNAGAPIGEVRPSGSKVDSATTRLEFQASWGLWSDLEDLCELISFNWYDNEGGEANITIDRATLEMSIEGGYNVTELVDAGCDVYDLTQDQPTMVEDR